MKKNIIILFVLGIIIHSIYLKLGFLSESYKFFWYFSKVNILNNFVRLQHGYLHRYMPVYFLITKLSMHLFGLNPVGYRILALFMFYSNILLFYYFLNLIKINKSIIAIVLLFCIFHPILSEVVSFTLISTVLINAMLTFLCLIFYIKFVCSREKNRLNKYYFLSFLFFIIALANRESAYLIPVFCLLLFNFLSEKIEFKKHLTFVMPYFVILFVFFIFLFGYVFKGSFFLSKSVSKKKRLYFNKYQVKEKSLPKRILILSKQITRTIPKKFIRAVLPYFLLNKRIVKIYNPFYLLFIYGCVLIFFIIMTYYLIRSKNKIILIWFVYFLLSILPTLLILKGRTDWYFKFGFRYYYMPSFFIFMIFSVILSKIINNKIKYIVFAVLIILTSYYFHFKIYNELNEIDYKIRFREMIKYDSPYLKYFSENKEYLDKIMEE